MDRSVFWFVLISCDKKLKSLLNDKNLGLSVVKALANYNLIVAETIELVHFRIENILIKKKFINSIIFHFPTMLLKGFI